MERFRVARHTVVVGASDSGELSQGDSRQGEGRVYLGTFDPVMAQNEDAKFVLRMDIWC